MTLPEQTGNQGFPLLSALSQGIQSGELTLTRCALDQAAEATGRYIDAMKKLQRTFDREGAVQGFGNLPSGRAIALHFTDKQREMVDVLDQYIEVATRIKAVFTDAAQRYSTAHEDHVAALHTVDAGH
ncbi:hypothetical protein [Hoyosella altamirensis]|uniref:hypothetical protein n=1 Tax=Hoyosella altamirensis TaxID=616997 RepID=UPI0007DB5E22|nr:hypothetical protein [Hoyosella altamirensis]